MQGCPLLNELEPGDRAPDTSERLPDRWPVRSPESSLAPATVCPTVTVKGFPETPTSCAAGLMVPPADSLWETMVTLILALLEALLGVGLGVCLLLPWDLSSSLSRPSI